MTERRPPALLLLVTGVGILLTPVLLPAHDPITTRVTWNGEISRIVQARCVSCHTAGGAAPMPLTSWQEARPWAKAIKEEVMTRRMPLWHAVRGYGDFSNDPSLSPFEMALIAAWADGGAPLGAGPRGAAPATETAAAPSGERTDTPEGTEQVEIPCGDRPLPAGRLRAVALTAPKGTSVGLGAAAADGRREIIALIRDYDPRFARTYWLRNPLDLSAGTRLIAERLDASTARGLGTRQPASNTPCTVTLTIQAPR